MAARPVHPIKLSVRESKLLKKLELGQFLCARIGTRSTQSVDSKEYGYFIGEIPVRIDRQGFSMHTSHGGWKFREVITDCSDLPKKLRKHGTPLPYWIDRCINIEDVSFTDREIEKTNTPIYRTYNCYESVHYAYIQIKVALFFKRIPDDFLNDRYLYTILTGTNNNLKRQIHMREGRFSYCHPNGADDDRYAPRFGFTKEEMKNLVIISVDELL
jgi:hypothetical protein